VKELLRAKDEPPRVKDGFLDIIFVYFPASCFFRVVSNMQLFGGKCMIAICSSCVLLRFDPSV